MSDIHDHVARSEFKRRFPPARPIPPPTECKRCGRPWPNGRVDSHCIAHCVEPVPFTEVDHRDPS